MPTPTYTSLATVTLGSTATSVTFSNIPATYRDLIFVFEGVVSAGGGEVVRVNFNGDTTSGNYSATYANGDGAGRSSGNESRRFGVFYAQRSSMVASFMDYSATNKHKTYLSRAGGASNALEMIVGRWANTAAITSIRLFPDANGFASGSTLNLYGVIS
jgi:hypothetical protein